MVARTAREALRACEQRLQAAAANGAPDVAGSAIDTLAAGGKRLRPLLVLCCAGQLSEPEDGVLRAAAAVELVHMATLVHDDLLDGATLRRGRATVSSSRGPAAAVQVGDFLFAQAFAQLAGAGHPDAVRTLAATALDLSLGELAQGRAAHDLLLREGDYTDRVRRKTASLFAAACRIGGMLGGADADGQDRLAEFGDAVGMAFQIFDDILDYTGDPAVTGKRRGADLRDGTVTLPVILALRDDPALAGAIRAAGDDAAIEALCDRLAPHPATAEARRRALEHVARAREAVVVPVGNADTHALQAIADGVVDRYS